MEGWLNKSRKSRSRSSISSRGEDLLGQMIDTGISRRAATRAASAPRSCSEDLRLGAARPSFVVDQGVTKTIQRAIAAIDEMLSKQVNEILHHPEFQRLEAAWRGLNKLVMQQILAT